MTEMLKITPLSNFATAGKKFVAGFIIFLIILLLIKELFRLDILIMVLMLVKKIF